MIPLLQVRNRQGKVKYSGVHLDQGPCPQSRPSAAGPLNACPNLCPNSWVWPHSPSSEHHSNVPFQWPQHFRDGVLLLPVHQSQSRLITPQIPCISVFTHGCHVLSPCPGNVPSSSRVLGGLILSLLISRSYFCT